MRRTSDGGCVNIASPGERLTVDRNDYEDATCESVAEITYSDSWFGLLQFQHTVSVYRISHMAKNFLVFFSLKNHMLLNNNNQGLVWLLENFKI